MHWLKLLLVVLSVVLFIWLVLITSGKPKLIALANATYECESKGCIYSFSVENLGDSLLKGYARLTVFNAMNVAGINSDQVLATERIEFNLAPKESKVLKGFFQTGIEASKMTFGVGEINK